MPNELEIETRQIAILAVIGAVLWFAAAMFIRFAGPRGVFEGPWGVVTYAVLFPVTAPALVFGRRAARLGRPQTLLAATVMSGAALFLDGIAIAWFPGLYGADRAIVLKGAAAILWGVGVALALGLAMSMQRRAA